MNISNTTRVLCGIILITVPTIEFGGAFLLNMLRTGATGYVDNALRQDLFRAGHAHAGVIVLLSLISQVLADATALSPGWQWIARLGAPIAAVLMPLGFFLSVASPTSDKPGALISLVYVGAILLAVSMLALGVGLIRSGLAK